MKGKNYMLCIEVFQGSLDMCALQNENIRRVPSAVEADAFGTPKEHRIAAIAT